MKYLFLFAPLLFPLTGRCADTDNKTTRVFIFAGQSNMVGSHSRVTDIQRFPPFAELAKPQENVLFSYKMGREQMTTSKGWIPLQPTGDFFGPEVSFGRQVSQLIEAPVAIIKIASGGTTLGEDWNPDTPGGFKLYPLALQHIRASLAELDQMQKPYRLEGFMWHQGENDMFHKDFKLTYGLNLKTFLSCWRRDLKAPHLKFYIGELCTKTIWGMDNRENMYAIRAGQKAVTEADPLAEYIPTSHDAVEIGDGGGLHYHYGTLGQLEHGANYADAYLRTIGKKTETKRPLAAWPYEKGGSVKLFVLAGHRNMEGERAFTQELKTLSGHESLAADNPKIAFKYSIGGGFRASSGWEPLGPAGFYDTFGPELSFGQALQSKNIGNIAIAKFTHSGSQINDWTPQGTSAKDRNLYAPFIHFIKESIKQLEDKGQRVELAGVFYHLGENDMSFGAYRRDAAKWLQATIAQSRTDLAMPALKWFVSQQPPTDHAGLNQLDVTEDLAELARGDASVFHLKAFDLPPQREKLVITTEGIVRLGEVLAQSYPPATKFVIKQEKGEMAGYLLVPNERVPETFNAGFSMYISAWPLLKQYPGQRFQSGLPGTWMFAQPVGKPLEKGYSDIEGGLGWWRDTEYATETPKFIMGGVAPNFVEWANGPGAGKGRDWSKPNGKYAIAQLSPWVIWPPDGLNLRQGTRGEWFGYGYLPLPLATAKDKTEGKDIPTGDQCWTLFLNSGNFKGPVTFFLPYFWSKAAAKEPRFAGHLLDSRPSNPNRALQMETQHIPSVQAADSKGVIYARVTPTQFPSDGNGESALVHRITSYNKQALWDSVQTWFNGGPVASGAVNSEAAVIHEFPGRGGATWKIYPDGTERDAKTHVAWTSFATPFAPDKNTFGYKWNSRWVKRDAGANGRDLIVLPEYFRLDKDDTQRPIWTPVAASEVPAETGLADANFDRKRTGPPKTYETPAEADSSWKKPGPKAGPFQARPGDGSIITYYWYRFADQPALLNADMTDVEREAMQQRVELLHRHWSKDRNYFAPPASGELADLDPAMIVTPPTGLEVGYVPIVTRQEPAE
ncbi:MAG: hypothetical protein O3A37_06980 [Planctomycetota bacterium]|nr:hypothetical protein [Planctomycetota bacterium]